MRLLAIAMLCLGLWQPAIADDLLAAAARGDAPAVAQLLAAGADIRQRNARGQTALLVATHGRHTEVARLLIAAGADVNAQDDIHDSPYLLAGANGAVEILRLTLANGADLKSRNRFGGTALIPACERGHVEVVRELLKTRIDIDHINNLGWTCLLEVVILGDGGARHVEITQMLIAAGARLDIADRNGVSALTHARRRGQTEIARLLVEAGAR